MSSVTPVVNGQQPAESDHRWLILVIVAIAQLMVVLDATVVNIALPSAQHALGFANSDRQWVVTAYALAFGSLLLLGGRLGDMFSRKRIFIIGLIGFALASALGGAATSFGMLVAARALQGAFGAILAPSALGTLVSTFRDPRERGRAFGVFGSVAAGGGAVGLILGGVLTQYFSWRWCLYVNLIFAAIAVTGALVYMQTSRPDIRPRMDWAGAVLAAAGLFLIVFGFSHAETASWSAPLTIGSLAGGVIALAGFAFAESRVSHPLLPLRVVLNRARGGSYLSVGLSGIAIFGVFLFLTYYLQTIKHYSPVTSGLAFLPMIACILLASNISSIVLLPRASCVASSSPRLRDRQASIDSAIRMHYNECVLKKVRDSDWSADHIATHDVTLDEVREAILEHPYWSVPGRDGTSLIYGRTYAGRYLFVVAIAEGEEAFIITARDMTDAEKRTFHRKAR